VYAQLRAGRHPVAMAKRVNTKPGGETPPGPAVAWTFTCDGTHTQVETYTPTAAELEDAASRARTWVERNERAKKREEDAAAVRKRAHAIREQLKQLESQATKPTGAGDDGPGSGDDGDAGPASKRA